MTRHSPFAPLLLSLALLLGFPSWLPAARPVAPPPKPPPPRHGRDTQVIDGAWRFLPDPDNQGEKRGWDHAVPSGTREIAVPGLWGTAAAPGYAGAAWYWREFDVSSNWRGQTVRLQFNAVAENARVWLNGKPLGAHTDGATPFEFNVTPLLTIGEKNTLAVRVEGSAKTGAGIWQGVLLVVHDEAYLADCFPQADDLGHLSAVITLANTSDKSGDAELDARLIAANAPTHDVNKTQQFLHLTPDRNLTTMLISVRGKSLHLWSPSDPFLYAVQLAFRQDRDVLDTLETPFGFHSFGYANGTITVNGEAVRLTTVAPLPALPVVIATTDDVVRARESLRRLKDRGVTLVYLQAPPPTLLRLADEEGLLVVESARPGQLPKAAADEMRDLIRRDRFHPCLLAWNLGDADAATAQSTRQLDPTRFLLVGPTAAAAKLWLPGQTETTSVIPPPGFLPPT